MCSSKTSVFELLFKYIFKYFIHIFFTFFSSIIINQSFNFLPAVICFWLFAFKSHEKTKTFLTSCLCFYWKCKSWETPHKYIFSLRNSSVIWSVQVLWNRRKSCVCWGRMNPHLLLRWVFVVAGCGYEKNISPDLSLKVKFKPHRDSSCFHLCVGIQCDWFHCDVQKDPLS